MFWRDRNKELIMDTNISIKCRHSIFLIFYRSMFVVWDWGGGYCIALINSTDILTGWQLMTLSLLLPLNYFVAEYELHKIHKTHLAMQC